MSLGRHPRGKAERGWGLTHDPAAIRQMYAVWAEGRMRARRRWDRACAFRTR